MVISILAQSIHDKERLLRLEGPKKNTALHLAVLYRHKDTAKALVEHGASLTIHNEYNDMPISYCTDSKMLQTLLSTPRTTSATNNQSGLQAPANSLCTIPKEDIGKMDAIKKSILHYASLHLKQKKSTDAFSKWISMASPGQLLRRDKDGATFLDIAAMVGNTRVLEALQRGIDPTNPEVRAAVRDMINGEIGLSALMKGHKGFVDQLVASSKMIAVDVKINVKALTEALLVEIAQTHGPATATELRTIADNSLPTYVALYADKYEAFEFMVESRLLTENQSDEEKKRTCLHWAVVHRRADIIERLLKLAHVRPSMEDAEGKMALQIAFEEDNQEAMEMLRGRADVKEHEEKLFRDREVYAQVLDGILVGAALIGGVTFAGWFQIPSATLAFETAAVKIFWGANNLSFYFAMASMCVSITALLPTPAMYVGDIVAQIRRDARWASILLGLSLVAVIMAFASAGFSAAPTWNS